MRIIDCLQRSEEWDRIRSGRPTASEFGRFCTPAKGEYGTGAKSYAATLAVQRLGAYIPPIPTAAMEWGTFYEPHAKEAYAARAGGSFQEVGFVMPDDTDAYGGSPDGLIGDCGLLEVKCPKAETLALWALNEVLPVEYKPQVQGLLMITGREWCDFFAWHPHPLIFYTRVYPDLKYQEKIANNLLTLLEEVQKVERALRGDTF